MSLTLPPLRKNPAAKQTSNDSNTTSGLIAENAAVIATNDDATSCKL